MTLDVTDTLEGAKRSGSQTGSVATGLVGFGRSLLRTTPILLAVAGCHDGAPLPAVHPDIERLEGIRFGMYAADVRAARPDLELAPEGFYREYLSPSRVLGYGFLPWMEGRPPAPGSRLQGIEIREEHWDTLEARSRWAEAVRRTAGVTSLSAECLERSHLRYRERRATFRDSMHVAVTLEIHRAPDGRDVEAFVSTRMETRAMRRAREAREGATSALGRALHPVRCPP